MGTPRPRWPRSAPAARSSSRARAPSIDALAREAGVDAGTIDLDVDLACYVADQGRTAWEHVSTLAGWAGALASTTADGSVEVTPFPSAPADLALRYGREIAELGVSAGSPAARGRLVGNGPPATRSDPDARTQSIATLPDGAPGPDAQTPPRRSPRAADARCRQHRQSGARAATTGRRGCVAACWLVPGLRAGTTVEIADAPTRGASRAVAAHPGRAPVGPGPAGRTTFDAIGLASSGGSGLLGEFAGAVGGLL